MSLTTYQIALDWVPDPLLVNAPVGLHYLAWQIGVNESSKTGLWLIAPVVDSPEPLENIIPDAYLSSPLVSDTPTLGYTRAALPASNISDVEAKFNEEVANAIAAVIEGTR
jgi:hypothetical protein